MSSTRPAPITDADVRAVGRLLKPHGVCGEITALVTADVDLSELSCILLRLDGIYVPFFIASVRPKSAETDLLTLDGISDDSKASALCPTEIFALVSELPADEDTEGFYASDLIGFEAMADGNDFGKITGIDDTTENYLFIIETPGGEKRMIPVTDEFIDDIDQARRIISFSLPEGLIDL